MSERVLPEGWVSTTLGELCELNPKQKLDDELEVGFMPMTGVPTTFHEKPEFETRKWEAVKKGYTQFKDGDVLFAKITPCFENGKATVVEGFPCGWGAGSTEYHVLRPRAEVVDPRLLLAFVRTKDFLNNGELNMSGSVGHKRVPKDFIASYSFPLMPKEEQKLIADKLDELLAQVNNLKTRLDAIPAILKRFRQSVLAAAVSGSLTDGWRGAPELTGWEDVYLGDVIEKPRYGTSSKSQKHGDVPVLRMGNLQQGEIDWGDLVYTSDPSEIEKYTLKKGDVLFNRTNSPDLVGKTSIYRGGREAVYAGYLICLRSKSRLVPDYLNYHLNSPRARRYCKLVKSDGVSQSNINAKKVAAYPMLLPPIEEQAEIVRRVDQLFAFADQIEQQVANAQTRVDKLTQSILAKAFRGELTAEWRAENPELISGEHSAEALLERIKAEKAKQKPAKTRRGGRKATVTS
ncbi:restriction endonuclease subunit S [Halomonas alkalicola]|uniref:Restriction endonuclease subunit S n=1 Tax=Halomonas alkalicola TaxID=1930622 RepID=A0ABY9H8J7_9GAMM|nr:restriction endonuclease subunit S [Halomonas alkalicola]WLI74427.1 restriction endonuclease subunit S [Halomonas alkalicola]